MTRPAWAETSALLRDYYDTEWGFPIRDSAAMYERIALEGFQAGLSWAIVLGRRESLRAAFAGFDPDAVAAFTETDVERLLADPGIIRNRRKINAAIINARATVAMREAGEELAELVWSFRPESHESTEAPSDESVALSRALKERGFTLVGPISMYALMEAVGVIEHRLPDSPRSTGTC